ncbi:MAG: hypothetical protein L0Y71_16065 [Gemmataceae bacterium]|nr:hypothetical protein [Gemmataceae bacterium]
MQRAMTALLMIPVLAFLAGVTGCGKEDKPKPVSTGKLAPADGGGQAAGGKKTMIKPGTAKIVGRVVLGGQAPTAASLEPTMKEHKDQAVCLAGSPHEKIEQTWLTGKGNGVENVAIWLNPPAGSAFEPGQAKGDAVLDQPHCVYIPHVLVVKPGQKLLIKNGAPVAHNTKLDVDQLSNKPFGQTIPPKGSATHELNPQSNVITVTCDFHGWMKAKIWAVPHQYAAVTDEHGNFVIENVPEGDFALVAWHEGPGFFHGGKKGTKTTIKAGENKLDLKVPTD